MADQDPPDPQYQPKDAISATVTATAITGTAGLVVSSIQNTLTRQNVGALGFLNRTGGTIAVFAAMGTAYEFAKTASANLREVDDAYNPAIGGFLAGTMLGLRYRSIPAIFGYGSALAAILGTFTYTGGHLGGFARDKSIDEVARKEYLRKNRRRPVDEIINELGERRGVHAPGYEERRAQRIKARYGIDVNQSTSLT